jgi:hypothetical protein
MFRKRIPLLFVSMSVLLASCNSGDVPLGPDSPMITGAQCGDIVFDIQKNSTKEMVGTMKFLPLEENKISIVFSFNNSLNEAFVFTYSSKIFSIARHWDVDETTKAEDRFFNNYPYVEKSDSLHGKLSKIVFEGVTSSVTEGTSAVQRIALNGSGILTFEYNAVFDPSKHFYACEGTSYISSGFSLLNKDGTKAGEGCHEWYYVSNKDLFEF